MPAGVAIIVVGWLVISKQNTSIPVTVEEVTERTLVETVSASGKIFPQDEARLGTGLSGEVVELYVAEGDTVKQGALLARVRTDGSSTTVNLPQLRGMFPQAAATPSSGSTVTLRAPISGIVTQVSARKGERMGGLSAPELIRVADLSAMELRAEVSENDVIRIATGDSATVEIDAYPNKIFKGSVRKISNYIRTGDMPPMAGREAANYEIRIMLDTASYNSLGAAVRNPFPLRSGMNARASIITRRKQKALAVPAGAVATREVAKQDSAKNNGGASMAGFEEYVFVVNQQDEVNRRVITTGIQEIGFFEVVQGLKPGERVVTGPYEAITKSLNDGSRIKIVSKENLFENR